MVNPSQSTVTLLLSMLMHVPLLVKLLSAVQVFPAVFVHVVTLSQVLSFAWNVVKCVTLKTIVPSDKLSVTQSVHTSNVPSSW